MKRTPLLRKTALKRKTPLRARSKRKAAHWAHLRDSAYKAWIKAQPCVGREFCGHVCWGPIDPSHTGKKPAAFVKADDKTCIPKCRLLHDMWEDRWGFFRGWDQGRRDIWAALHVHRLRLAYVGPIKLELDHSRKMEG